MTGWRGVRTERSPWRVVTAGDRHSPSPARRRTPAPFLLETSVAAASRRCRRSVGLLGLRGGLLCRDGPEGRRVVRRLVAVNTGTGSVSCYGTTATD